MNLQLDDRETLYACKSDADWAKALAVIKARHDGELPDDWHLQMVVGGLEASLREGWPKKPAPTELTVDPTRLDDSQTGDPHAPPTGIYIRAKRDGLWGTYDIKELDRTSLLAFLRQRGGENTQAENIVGILLGYGNLHER